MRAILIFLKAYVFGSIIIIFFELSLFVSEWYFGGNSFAWMTSNYPEQFPTYKWLYYNTKYFNGINVYVLFIVSIGLVVKKAMRLYGIIGLVGVILEVIKTILIANYYK